jgi:hypothetical protein
LVFPALLDAIKNLRGRVAAAIFSELGFVDPATRSYTTSFEQLARGISHEDVSLPTILDRSTEQGTVGRSPVSPSFLQRIITSILSVLTLSSLAISIGLICVLVTTRHAHTDYAIWIWTMFYGNAVLFIVPVLWRIVERRRNLSFMTVLMAMITPFQNLLRKISQILPHYPWAGFIVAVFLMSSFSLPGLYFFWMFRQGVSRVPLGVWLIMVTLPVFIGLSIWYYQKYVLRMTSAGLLLSLHPKASDMIRDYRGF